MRWFSVLSNPKSIEELDTSKLLCKHLQNPGTTLLSGTTPGLKLFGNAWVNNQPVFLEGTPHYTDSLAGFILLVVSSFISDANPIYVGYIQILYVISPYDSRHICIYIYIYIYIVYSQEDIYIYIYSQQYFIPCFLPIQQTYILWPVR